MASGESGEPAARLQAILGLDDDASPRAIEAAYQRLHHHVQSRVEDAPDAERRARYQAELDTLADRLAQTRAARRGGAARAVLARIAPALWLLAGAALLAALQWGLARVGQAEAVGRLVVRADPLDATLDVLAVADDALLASAPADGRAIELPAGEYRLQVAHADCPDRWEQVVTLAAGEPQTWAPRICRGEGGLVVRSNVSGDRVLVDGLDVGSSGEAPHPLRVGHHEVEVRKPGHRPWSGAVRILPDEQIVLQATLLPEAGAGAAASPETGDPGASRQAAASPGGGGAPPPPPAPAPAASATPPAAVPGPKDGATRPVRPRTGAGGSKSWHDAVKSQLVSEYDRNGSRSLDTREEIHSIPCSVWQAIESSYETGGLAVDMTHLYGFDGSEAPANTLGVTYEMRGYAYDRMKQCGLKARY